jgi:hypothetical protein
VSFACLGLYFFHIQARNIATVKCSRSQAWGVELVGWYKHTRYQPLTTGVCAQLSNSVLVWVTAPTSLGKGSSIAPIIKFIITRFHAANCHATCSNSI